MSDFSKIVIAVDVSSGVNIFSNHSSLFQNRTSNLTTYKIRPAGKYFKFYSLKTGQLN